VETRRQARSHPLLVIKRQAAKAAINPRVVEEEEGGGDVVARSLGDGKRWSAKNMTIPEAASCLNRRRISRP
jgi:hypothetical protein